MDLTEVVDEIERIAVDEQAIRGFSRKSEHFALAFDLFRETAQYTCALASVSIGGPNWTVVDAVYGGHLVRLFKLTRFIIEEAVHDRAELMWVLIRLTAECVVHLQYLIENRSPELIECYLFQSLQHERDLQQVIISNIASRDGKPLPIEERMLASIQRTFENSQVKPDQLPEKKIRDWGGRNFFEKARAVDLDHTYLAIFGAPSRNVHGGWHDLLQHHLNCNEPGMFSPRLEFTKPQAQPLFALAILVVDCLRSYIGMLNHEQLTLLLPRLTDLRDRIRQADRLHEVFLSTRAAAG